MFMVASSVVLTVLVLNFHHRTADIHEMPPWVNWNRFDVYEFFLFIFFPFILYQLFRNTHCVLFLPIRNSNILRMRNLLSGESFFRFHHINYILNTQIQCVSKVFVVCAAQFQYTQFFFLLPLCFWLRRRFRTTRFEPYFCNGCHGYCECHDRVVKLLENQF